MLSSFNQRHDGMINALARFVLQIGNSSPERERTIEYESEKLGWEAPLRVMMRLRGG